MDLPEIPVWRRKNFPFIAQPFNRGGSEMPANNLKWIDLRVISKGLATPSCRNFFPVVMPTRLYYWNLL